LRQGIPPNRDPAVRRKLSDAKEIIADHRRSPEFARRG
jgi:hypothetical protein